MTKILNDAKQSKLELDSDISDFTDEDTEITKPVKKDAPIVKDFDFSIDTIVKDVKPLEKVVIDVPSPEKAKRIKKQSVKGYKLISTNVVNMVDLIFKRIDTLPLTDEETEILSKNLEATLEHYFPEGEGKISPPIALLLAVAMIYIPRHPDFANAWKKAKVKRELESQATAKDNIINKPTIEQEYKPATISSVSIKKDESEQPSAEQVYLQGFRGVVNE